MGPRNFDVTGAVAHEWGATRAQAELEDQAFGRLTLNPHEPDVQAALVVEGAARNHTDRREPAGGTRVHRETAKA